MAGWLRHTPQARADIHVLYFGEPMAWLEQCLTTLLAEPVNIYLAPGRHDSIGAARAAAFREGTAPLIGFVDPDDWLGPNAYAASMAAYEYPRVMATYTDYWLVERHGNNRPLIVSHGPCTRAGLIENIWTVMHLHLYRRAAIMPHLENLATWPICEEAALAAYALLHGEVRKIEGPPPYYKRDAGQNADCMHDHFSRLPIDAVKTRLRLMLDIAEPPAPPDMAPPAPSPRWVTKTNRRLRRG